MSQHNKTQTNAFAKLDPNWKKWVIENIKMGCSTESIVKAMVDGGPFSENSAKNIIKEGRRELQAELEIEVVAEYPRPDINTQLNYIDLDRRINILMAVSAPRIVVIDNVISYEECESLIAYAEQHALIRSQTRYFDSTGQANNLARTSSEVVFSPGETDLLATIEKRICGLANWPIEKTGGIKVLRYDEGEFFMPHFDWDPPEKIKQEGLLIATFLLYLSDVEEGGTTCFPKLEMQIHPHRGMGVFFANMGKNGELDKQTYHSGEPVISGVKWIATKWLRAESFNPPLETQTE